MPNLIEKFINFSTESLGVIKNPWKELLATEATYSKTNLKIIMDFSKFCESAFKEKDFEFSKKEKQILGPAYDALKELKVLETYQSLSNFSYYLFEDQKVESNIMEKVLQEKTIEEVSNYFLNAGKFHQYLLNDKNFEKINNAFQIFLKKTDLKKEYGLTNVQDVITFFTNSTTQRLVKYKLMLEAAKKELFEKSKKETNPETNPEIEKINKIIDFFSKITSKYNNKASEAIKPMDKKFTIEKYEEFFKNMDIKPLSDSYEKEKIYKIIYDILNNFNSSYPARIQPIDSFDEKNKIGFINIATKTFENIKTSSEKKYLIDEINKITPEIVLCFEGNKTYPSVKETIEIIKSKNQKKEGVKLLTHYFLDDPSTRAFIKKLITAANKDPELANLILQGKIMIQSTRGLTNILDYKETNSLHVKKTIAERVTGLESKLKTENEKKNQKMEDRETLGISEKLKSFISRKLK